MEDRQLSQQQSAVEARKPPTGGLVGAGITGVVFGVIALFSPGGVGGVLLGIVCILGSITALFVSRFGTQWYELSKGQKALVIIGIIPGIVFVVATYVITKIFLLATQKS